MQSVLCIASDDIIAFCIIGCAREREEGNEGGGVRGCGESDEGKG